MVPKNWDHEEWHEYEEYLVSLSCQELENELKLLKSLGESKQRGNTVIVNESIYKM